MVAFLAVARGRSLRCRIRPGAHAERPAGAQAHRAIVHRGSDRARDHRRHRQGAFGRADSQRDAPIQKGLRLYTETNTPHVIAGGIPIAPRARPRSAGRRSATTARSRAQSLRSDRGAHDLLAAAVRGGSHREPARRKEPAGVANLHKGARGIRDKGRGGSRQSAVAQGGRLRGSAC